MSTPSLLWRPATATPAMADDDVHVWMTSTAAPPLPISRLQEWLSEGEQARARRFHFAHHRRGYIAGRAILRYLVAAYSGEPEPKRVAFVKGPRGKPYLNTRYRRFPLWFNQADSNGIALYAFTRLNEIGIDIEHMREVPDMDAFVSRTFSEAEQSAYFSLPLKDRKEAFFNCWTRKEAFIKAIGEGLYFPMDQFDVTLKPTEPARLLRVAERPETTSSWFMMGFSPLPGYKAALAIPRKECTISFWRFEAFEEPAACRSSP
jgi:4'-phosphopantetheinyl transferase